MKVKDHAEFVLKQFINEAKSEFSYINFETHSVLFKADFEPTSFYLFKQVLKSNDEIILYFPEPKEKVISTELMQTIMHLISNSLSLFLINKANKILRKNKPSWKAGEFFWGSSPVMDHLKKLVSKLASSDLSLLLYGETGSGKEALCCEIAAKSNYHRVVSVNCAAIPKDLAESYLFGHVKGSFTGATNDQVGAIEKANGATLFLDEVGELSIELQAKLLRVLQERVVEPIGGKAKKVTFRLITATHQDLTKKIQDGLFREDLYFRLNEAMLRIPSLGNRKEDLIDISISILDDFASTNSLGDLSFSSDALTWLKEYSWPGNFRELIATIRRGAILCEDGIISLSDLFNEDKKEKKHSWNLKEAKNKFVIEMVSQALEDCNGCRSEASVLLGISERSLYRLLSDDDVSRSAKNGSPDYVSH